MDWAVSLQFSRQVTHLPAMLRSGTKANAWIKGGRMGTLPVDAMKQLPKLEMAPSERRPSQANVSSAQEYKNVHEPRKQLFQANFVVLKALKSLKPKRACLGGTSAEGQLGVAPSPPQLSSLRKACDCRKHRRSEELMSQLLLPGHRAQESRRPVIMMTHVARLHLKFETRSPAASLMAAWFTTCTIRPAVS